MRDASQRARVTVVIVTLDRVEPRTLRVLVQRPDGAILRPQRTEASYVGESAGPLRYYINNVHAWFDYSGGLDPNEKVTVVVGWPDRTVSVEFDLSTLK